LAGLRKTIIFFYPKALGAYQPVVRVLLWIPAMKIPATLWLSFLLVAGCTGSGSYDAGGDPGPEVDGDIDNTGDEGGVPAEGDDGADPGPRPDFDPSGEFLLVIPPGTSLCSTLSTARNWEQELPMLGRIDLVAGHYVFPRHADIFESELVEGLLFGREGTALDSTALPGEVEVEELDLAGDTMWIYHLRKRFTDGNQPFVVEAAFSLDSRDGPWPEVVTLDSEFLQSNGSGMLRIGPGEDHMTEQQWFASCAYDGSHTVGHIATAEGGDRVEIEMGNCGWLCGGCFGFTICRYFYRAEVTLSGQSRTVVDPFRMVYSASHHNDGEHFLAMLDPPVDSVSAILVIEPILNLYSGELIWLDADLQEISRKDLTGWETVR
jgi:hypothetical protein